MTIIRQIKYLSLTTGRVSSTLNFEMVKDKRPLLISGLLLGILLTAGGGFFYLSGREPKKEEARPERELPQPLVTPPPAEEMPYEAYQTEDGNLSFEYPAAWIQTEIKNLETILPKSFIDKYELTMPLLLSDPRGAQVSLSAYRFEKGMDLDAVIDTLEAELAAMNQPYSEVRRQTVGEALVVDSTVDTQGTTVQIRDILFLVPGLPAGEAGKTKDRVYNISFSARQSSWGEYEPIFSHVQNSAKLSR